MTDQPQPSSAEPFRPSQPSQQPSQPAEPSGPPSSSPSLQDSAGAGGVWPQATPQWQAGPPPAQWTQTGSSVTPSDERLWAMLSHLSPFVASFVGLPFLGPLVIFLVYKDRSAFVRSQSGESLNFQITLLIAYIVCFALFFLIVPLVIAGLLWVAGIVLQVVAAVAANRGEDYRYPWTLRLVK